MPRNEDFHKLHILQQTLDLHVCCSQCCERKTEITLSLIELSHQCSRNILLVRQKDKNKQWKLVDPRPEFPVPEKYLVCSHYTEERGCTLHKNKCTYARSKEEAKVWNFMKTEGREHSSLIKLITSSLTSPNEQDDLEEILFRFQGAFVELCETCFRESPQKISTKVSGTCASKHKWRPVLVFRSKDKHKRVVYDEIRPLPKRTFQHWRLCRYVDNGKPCGQESQGCWFAHSEIEMAVWRSESRKSLDRPSLVHAAQMLQTQEQNQQHYCYVCKCQFLEYEDFMNHCFSVEHRKLIFDDSTSKWRYRDPPLTSKALRMCRRLATCEYGSICVRAHSEEELKEWKDRRKAALKKEQAALDQGLLSYQDCLLEEYRESENKEVIMKESLPGVSVSCDSDLRVSVRQENISHQWKFKITSRSALHVVALLRHERGATFALGENWHEERSYSSGVWFQKSETSNNIVYEITVSFTCDRSGVYEQWLVLDFDMRPVLLQKLNVSVGMVDCGPQSERNQGNKKTQQGTNSSIGKLESKNTQQSEQLPVIWHEGTVEIVPYQMRSDNELFKKYSYTERKEFGTVMIGADLINQQNYKKKMHSFLCQEEMEQAQLVRRLNLRGTMSFKKQLFDDWSGLKISEELFGSIPVSYSLAPDTPEGYMLKRHVQSVLVDLMRPDCAPQRVYEAVILKDVIGESKLNVNLSRDCCNELQLQSDASAEMEVQFQLDRKWFCEMHKAVDMLPDLRRVLPDLRDRHVQVPVSNKSCPSELNEKQQAAMDFILGASDRKGSVAPLLIYGPFGTGKTLTLAKIALALVQQPQARILICTHTNSSADLYVSDHFHNSALTSDRPVRPLRIKAKESSPRATDDVTLQYCHLSKDHWYFEFPDRETLDAARIIITTTGMARYFHDLQLPSNYFSHIFIDEASQMLECEALMAIGLAGEKTQVILAGDHMQMGPKIFSVGVDKSSDHTLLNRLFHHYQAENTTTAKNSRIIFNENYRSTQEIVDFVSEHFYVGKTDGIKAKGNVPAHPHQNALQFYHVRGECYLDKRSMSCCNPDEIQIVVNLVLKLLSEWPNEWQPKDLASVCVLSQGSQVIEIRNKLKQYNLNAVNVENAENVQGKQYRVIIITTVHTKDSLNITERPCLEFFNDVRLLNTAMTRAQSQVIVVGDATALCCPYFGKCWRLWKSYINHCSETGSAFANEFTLDNLNQELMEISNIIQAKRDDSDDNDSESIISEVSDIDEDPILKELLDEKNDIQIKLTEDGQFPVLQTDSFENNVVRYNKASTPSGPQPLLVKQNHKTCKLIMDRYDHGFAMPIDEPSLKIDIKGKKNVGQSMTGDQVIVEILSSETFPPTGKVIEVVKQENLLREFVCTIDCNDDQVMTPISICIPKIYTPFWKDKPNHIAIKNPETNGVEKFIKINEEARRNLFVVKLLRWGRHFHHPLGIAVKELPRVTTLEKGLEVLRCEYNLNKTIPESVQREVENLVHTPPSLNHHEDFRKLMTFTIDPSTSEDLDDAISVRDLGEHYEIGVHIADVASFVAKGSELDKFAQQQETTFYVSQANPAHMFPKDLMANIFSLLPGCDRLCISLMTEVDKKTHQIQNRRFFKSVICSKKKLSYEAAEDILKASGNKRSFDTLEGCLAIACDFAEVHRKDRKQEDWCYQSPDEDEVVGSRRSHRLVEELMIMFNHTVADRFLFDSNTRGLAPLRCQDRPDRDLLQTFQNKHFASLSMSIHLSSKVHGQLSMMQQNQNTENEVSSSDSGHFPILTSVLKNLEIAEQEKDIHRIVDLITTDDLHPQLLPVALDLRRLIHKAQVLRASSSHLSRIGHYDLQLDCYTWASSPIRRYIDVIVQRLLLSLLDKTDVKYTSHDIDVCCVEFSQKNKDQTVCDTKSHALSLASQLSTQNVQKMAYVVEVNPTGNIFRISFPLNKNSIRETVGIMYKDLQLADQPLHDQTNDCMKLKWERRVYSFTNLSIHNELKKRQANSLTTLVPSGHWKSLLASIREENWNLMFELIRQIKTSKDLRTKTQISVTASKTETYHTEGEHYTELSLELKKGEIIKVQLGTDTNRGLMVPAVQLLIVNPKFEICIEHTRNPILCFSKYALHSTKTSYNTYMDYQKIWKPLCEMESASSAVAENESIVLEDVKLEWKLLHVKDSLQGSFRLPLEKKIQWAIEGNLKNCFICIRLRIHQKDLGTNLKNPSTESPHVDLTSLPGLIWIAHGIVTNVSDEEEFKKKDFMKIQFRINHKPMAEIPQCVFLESARFTLELIQKLLPDVRKEAAIDNVREANSLVKAIATGQNRRDKGPKIQTCQLARFEIGNHQFPELNNSQCSAIREALNNDFTLIQGPPGTGKTVVGVHIVYWFFQENQKLSPLDKSVEKGPKKRCILYCGPSNKSVDVVAGQLLKIEHKLKPLRVYSDQMEILEFPYPGSNLRLSRHSKRVETPNQDLRHITLHHKIRMPDNPFSSQIQAVDSKMQRCQQLSKEEIKNYKECLKMAREYELMKHDVILCTCTAASNPVLADVLIQQIIIDECAMATEPEAFIPLVTHRPKQIVLLGDHKQLQPVVKCELLGRLGMQTSLFERYMTKALMLDTQYRMQKDICEFPSQEFYEGRLKTGTRCRPSVFRIRLHVPTSIIFGHVEGKEESLVVATERGNENSKANLQEANEVVRMAMSLIRAKIKEMDIAILTPYNAQVKKIKDILSEHNIKNITVNTIMKSQGSEWRYVILTTVRSCPKAAIEKEPTKSWLLKKLGFVIDPHQVNVGITRAQEGLCIIGNRDLLQCNKLWRKLLKHYEDKGCVVDPAQNIQIARF
ncbi:3'-5' exoribonuclease HELZ2-like [Trichomycterus rosablanca]|uniref:3'-5' exoribonuclease HELZ2-like n=1 Tax=Trichomycterus rosablanca TaxID=2290929 RepID=UPI002F35231E